MSLFRSEVLGATSIPRDCVMSGCVTLIRQHVLYRSNLVRLLTLLYTRILPYMLPHSYLDSWCFL